MLHGGDRDDKVAGTGIPAAALPVPAQDVFRIVMALGSTPCRLSDDA